MHPETQPHIRFEPHDERTTVLHTSQWLPYPVEEVFAFFSRPENLQRLTPSQLQFQILTPDPIVMREGVQLDYKLKVHNIPLRWTSLISNWNPPHEFTDKQLKGPYKVWVHSHRFRTEGNGTQVDDHIQFRAPGGKLLEKLIVQRDLASIFNYRQKILSEIFGLSPAENAAVPAD
ncbi:MAG: SRPBCC family protein [Kiritimatiellia bacterium]